LTGLAVLVGGASPVRRIRWRHLVVASVLALGPDFLLLVGLAVGLDRFTAEGTSHSVLLVALVAAAAWLWVRKAASDLPPVRRQDVSWLPTVTTAGAVGLATAIWLTHPLLDVLSSDLAPQPGIPVLWPVWGGSLQLAAWFPVKVVETDSLEVFLRDVSSAPFLRHTALEALVVAPLLVGASLWRHRRRSRTLATAGPPSAPRKAR
jgi:hypothetical protein